MSWEVGGEILGTIGTVDGERCAAAHSNGDPSRGAVKSGFPNQLAACRNKAARPLTDHHCTCRLTMQQLLIALRHYPSPLSMCMAEHFSRLRLVPERECWWKQCLELSPPD